MSFVLWVGEKGKAIVKEVQLRFCQSIFINGQEVRN